MFFVYELFNKLHKFSKGVDFFFWLMCSFSPLLSMNDGMLIMKETIASDASEGFWALHEIHINQIKKNEQIKDVIKSRLNEIKGPWGKSTGVAILTIFTKTTEKSAKSPEHSEESSEKSQTPDGQSCTNRWRHLRYSPICVLFSEFHKNLSLFLINLLYLLISIYYLQFIYYCYFIRNNMYYYYFI